LYKLAYKKSPGREINRFFDAEFQRALQQLDQYASAPADSVHELRQSIKRSRAMLRLLRPSNPYICTVENIFLREVASGLSRTRDIDAARETVARLGRNAATRADRKLVRQLEKRVVAAGSDDKAPATRLTDATLADLHLQLTDAEERFRHVRFHDISPGWLIRRCKQSFRETMEAYHRACMKQEDALFHDWRKRAKRTQTQLMVCRVYLPNKLCEKHKPLKRITRLLGDFQDLHVLCSELEKLHPLSWFDFQDMDVARLIYSAKKDIQSEAIQRMSELS